MELVIKKGWNAKKKMMLQPGGTSHSFDGNWNLCHNLCLVFRASWNGISETLPLSSSPATHCLALVDLWNCEGRIHNPLNLASFLSSIIKTNFRWTTLPPAAYSLEWSLIPLWSQIQQFLYAAPGEEFACLIALETL